MSARIVPAALAAALLLAPHGATARPLSRTTTAQRATAVARPDMGAAGLETVGLDKPAFRALRGQMIAAPAPSPALATTFAAGSGPFPMACSSLDLTLDAFGALGSSTSGGDARFRAGGATFGTIFEFMASAAGAGFLEGGTLALPQSAAGASLQAGGVHASYVAGPWRFELRSSIEECAPEHAVLRQEWIVTNIDAVDRLLAFDLYLDGDLFARGTYDDDFGARVGDELFLFDEGSDPDHPTAFVGLSTDAPDALRVRREVGEFSEQRRRVARAGFVTDRLVRADGSRADLDGDGVTDVGFDASLAISHDFGMIPPGQSRTVVARVRWGVGSIHDVALPAPVVDAGADRIVECEGREGTLVRLDAGASPDAARIVEWTWGLDGVAIASGPVADVLLLPGAHVVSLEGVDAQGRLALDEALVEIVDSLAPVVVAGPVQRLWPPDHRMVPVAIALDATDACSDVVSFEPVAVIVDEAEDARGDGRTSPDARLLPDGTLLLRAERSGTGDGRVYRVVVEVRDAAGNLTLGEVRVEVPHDAHGPAIDSGSMVEMAL